MSALPLPSAAAPIGGHHHFIAMHAFAHRVSVAVHTAFARSADDDGGVVVPRHYPPLLTDVLERSAMQREMFRL